VAEKKWDNARDGQKWKGEKCRTGKAWQEAANCRAENAG